MWFHIIWPLYSKCLDKNGTGNLLVKSIWNIQFSLSWLVFSYRTCMSFQTSSHVRSLMSQASPAAQYHEQTFSKFDQSTHFLQFFKISTISVYFTSYVDKMMNQSAQKCTQYIYWIMIQIFQIHAANSIKQ